MRQKQRDITWGNTQNVLIALGNITIGWAGIGVILNRFIEAYQANVGTVIRKDIPRSFTQKLEYLEAVERDVRWTKERRDKIRAFRLKLASMNEFRINIVHGLLMRPGYGPKWTVHINKEVGNALLRRTIIYTGQDILDFAGEVSNVGGEMSRFFAPIVGVRHPDLE